jgi:hypothetical protein
MCGPPGKKLLFMGGDFAQSENGTVISLDWHLLASPFNTFNSGFALWGSSGGAIPSFPATPKYTLLPSIVRLNFGVAFELGKD